MSCQRRTTQCPTNSAPSCGRLTETPCSKRSTRPAFNCMQDQLLRVDTSEACVGDKRAPRRMPMLFEESLHGCGAHESQHFLADNFIDLMGPGWPQGCAGRWLPPEQSCSFFRAR